MRSSSTLSPGPPPIWCEYAEPSAWLEFWFTSPTLAADPDTSTGSRPLFADGGRACRRGGRRPAPGRQPPQRGLGSGGTRRDAGTSVGVRLQVGDERRGVTHLGGQLVGERLELGTTRHHGRQLLEGDL